MLVRNSYKKEAAPRIFWNHINVLGRKLGTVQPYIFDEDGNKLEGDAPLNYVRKIIAESFQSNGGVVSEETKRMNENQTEKELVLSNFNWKKAEEKIPKRTATGLHVVPVRLINELEPKSKEALLKAVTKCLQHRRIPDSWTQSRMELIYNGKGGKDKIHSY